MAEGTEGISLKIDGDMPQTVKELRKALQDARQEMEALAKAGVSASQEFKNAKAEADRLEHVMDGGDLKKQLEDANTMLALAKAKFGETSIAAAEAAKSVAKITEQVGDAETMVKAFSAGEKFKAMGDALKGVAGGLSAMQGLMSMLGSNSKVVEQQIAKVEEAMKITEGLTAMQEGVEAFKNLGLMIKTNVISAFNSLRTAIGGTGIGLLVIAVSALIANFDDLKKYVTGIFPELKNTGKLLNDLKQVAAGVGTALTDLVITPFRTLGKVLSLDFQGAIDEVKKGYSVLENYKKGRDAEALSQQKDANDKLIEDKIKYYQNQAAILKAAGKDSYFEELAVIAQKQKLHQDDKEKLAEDLQEEKVFRARHQKEIADQQQAADEQAAGKRAEALARQRQLDAEAAEKKKDALKEADKIEQEIADNAYARTHTAEEAELHALEEKLAQQKAIYAEAGKDITNLMAEYEAEREEIRNKYLEQAFSAQHNAEEREQYALTNKFAAQIATYEQAGKDTVALVEAYEQQSAEITAKYAAQKKAADDADKAQASQEATDAINKKIADKELDFSEENASASERKEFLKTTEAEINANDKLSQDQKTQLLRENAAARKEIDKQEADTRMKAMSVASSALTSFSTLVGEHTATGKAMAVAAATISTIQSAVSSFNSLCGIPIVGPALGAVAAAGAVAAGIANVKKIVSVKVPGKGGGGGGSVPAAAASAASAVPALTSTTISNTEAPIQPTTTSGGSGMNAMLGGVQDTQQQLAGAVTNLNSTLQGGINAQVVETQRAQVAGQLATIRQGATLGG